MGTAPGTPLGAPAAAHALSDAAIARRYFSRHGACNTCRAGSMAGVYERLWGASDRRRRVYTTGCEGGGSSETAPRDMVLGPPQTVTEFMMFSKISVASSPRETADALVLGVFQPESNGKPAQAALDGATAKFDTTGEVGAALARPEFNGEAGKCLDVVLSTGGGARGKGGRKGRSAGAAPARVILVGLGMRSKFDIDALRQACCAATRKAAEVKAQSVVVELAAAASGGKGAVESGRAGEAFGECVGMLAGDFDEFRGSAAPAPKRNSLRIASSDKGFASGVTRGLAMAEAVNFGRRIGNTPPNVATPMWIARKAQAMARETGLKCKVFSGAELVKHKFEGIRVVGQASENKGCMIRLEYSPKGSAAKKQRPLVLVGKTMTYDTGGLSLKVNNGMRGMKGDKDGGCAVLGAMMAIATVVKPDRPVVALLCAAENSVSDNAYRPDDVMTFRNGVTVEVTNTDAEGRLVLADGLCWACKEENAAAVVDIATLTGGVVVALGSTFAGMWCEDDAFRAKVEAASAHTGERVWRLPMHREYRDMMKSSIADIINSNPDRKAHPIQGAAFLDYFVTPGTAWCHLDIAGVHRAEGGAGGASGGNGQMFAKDTPTGFGARLMAEIAARM